MSEIKDLTTKVIEFRDKRNWKQFHNPKDLALSLTLEAAEVMEHFQWQSLKETKEYVKTNKSEIAKELADVLYWVLLISYDLDINIGQALEKKIIENDKKYPVNKAKNRHDKYTKL